MVQDIQPQNRKRRRKLKSQIRRAKLKIVYRSLSDLKPSPLNARKHSEKQISILARAIEEFGFTSPILIDCNGEIIAGHGRLEAASRCGLDSVPTVLIEHLSPAQIRALRLADNRLAELSEWDDERLRIELTDLSVLELEDALEFDLDVIGFETPELDIILRDQSTAEEDREDVELPDPMQHAVTRLGDHWVLGRHSIICGSALSADTVALITEGPVRMIFTDPPYNVPIHGHVRGQGGHREFAMASGEMSEADFRDFLSKFIDASTQFLMPGGIAMICMDWRHIEDLIAVGRAADLELINLCVWNKTNGGMGSLYRSKHELVAVFRKPGAVHVNNVELGRHGRYRTNVWDYAGVNTFRAGREADLADHPTIKPTAMIADAIRDVSHRGDLILDPFGGSGSALLAAERTGRKARLVEIDPHYVDLTIRRWQEMTGQRAHLQATGQSFEQVSEARDADGEEADHA